MQEQPKNELSLHAYTERAYLEYAIATVKGRALVQVEDGLKPVQRRILYTMSQLGLREDAKPVKCARIVGDVLGKYHPHGDQAAYDALVRVAQGFSLRYPLILGQGNFGSRDGDPAAAMRYTEAKLSPVARLLLDELDLGTVDFIDNYDGSFKEPARLPDRLPFVLLNGGFGIAVGMASSIPSHNLREVAAAAALVITNPQATLDDVLAHIQGPDYPDGGHIISSADDIRSAYESGRGSVRMRGRYEREDLARGQWQLVFNELPYEVSGKQILEELDSLTNPKIPAGKKALTQQQLLLKQLGLDLIERANDESGKDYKVRVVISPKNSKVSQDELLAFLFANTSLEANASINLTLVALDGRPQTKSLDGILHEWAVFRVKTVRRRVEFELSHAEKRIHLLEGRVNCLTNIEEVIRIVRKSEEPLTELMAAFSLSTIQAEDILQIRLSQLNKLETLKLEKELGALRKVSNRLNAILASDTVLRKLIVEEIEADAKKYGDDRRTLIKAEARAKSANAVVRSTVDEPVTVVISKNLWVRVRPGHDVDVAALPYRSGDEAWLTFPARTSQQIALLDSKGRSYSIRTSDIPGGRGDGVPLTTLLDLQDGAKLQYAFVAADEDRFLFAGQQGYGLVAPFKSLLASKRAGKVFLVLEAGEQPLPPAKLDESSKFVYCASGDGRLLVYPIDEVKTLAAGGKGVKLMDTGGSVLSHIGQFNGSELHVTVDANGNPSRAKLSGESLQRHVLHRGRKGQPLVRKGAVLLIDTADA